MGLEDFSGHRPSPPMEWFSAFGGRDTGISYVSVNERFFFDNDVQVGHYYVEWREQMRIFNSPDSSPRTIRKAGKAILKAESIISKAIDFSPRDISGMAHQLSEQYRGKKEARIDTRLL